MNRRLLVGALAVVTMASIVVADDALKSGPQTGTNIPGPFHPLNVTGAAAGKKNCLV